MADQTAPDALLAEVSALRRRTRVDRHAHWFPLVVLGMLILGAVPVYAQLPLPVPGDPIGTDLYFQAHKSRIARYWLAALPVGALLTAWWYRRHGHRVGLEGAIGTAVAAAALAIAGYFVLSLLPLYDVGPVAVLFWIEMRSFGALLVIAVGLLTLAATERSRLLGAIAVLYAAAAVLVNYYDLANLVPFPGERWVSLPSLLLAGGILLAGGVAAGARAALGRAAGGRRA